MNAHGSLLTTRAAYGISTGRNFSQLIFHGSDEDNSSSEEDNPPALCLTVRETAARQPVRGQLRTSFRAEPTLLKQSLMRAGQNEDEYLCGPVAKRNNFVSEQQEEGEIKIARKSLPATLIFVDLEEEEEEQSKMAEVLRETAVSGESAGRQRSASEQEERSSQKGEPHLQKQESSESDKQTVDERVSLLKITQKTKKRGAYFERCLQGGRCFEEAINVMLTPLWENTAQIFQVHVYSSLTEKRFELWMDSLPTMRLLMRAEKSVWPHRTTYGFTAYLEYCQQSCPAGSLISNFDRSEFTLETEDQAYLLATVACGTTLQNSKNLVLYYPTRTSGRIFKKAQRDSLKQIYQEQEGRNVEYVVTGRIEPEEKKQLMNEYGLRDSEKSMEFRGRSGELRVVIGKKGSKRYCLIVGPHLSPIQAFALAIVNIQTS